MAKSTQRPDTISVKSFPVFVTKVIEDEGIVEAIVSVMGFPDHGRDVVHPGAFTKTINERFKQIRVLDAHNTDSIECVIGLPQDMRELRRDELPPEILTKYPTATGGLWTRTKYLLDVPEGLGAFVRIKTGAINEYSFGYEALDFDYGEVEVDGKKVRVRNLRTIKLWEYGPVIWGMNSATTTTDIKQSLTSDDTSSVPKNVSDDPEKVEQPASTDSSKELTADGPVQRIGDYIHGCMIEAFTQRAAWLYSCGYLTEPQWKALSESMTRHLTEFRAGLDDEVALIPIGYYGHYGAMSGDPSIDIKVGRTLSNSNALRIRGAFEALLEVLQNAGLYGDEDDDQSPETDEDKGTEPSARPAPSETSTEDLRLRALRLRADHLEHTLDMER